MPQIELTLNQVDNDNCRVYFTSPGERLYCFQLVKRGAFTMLECTDEGEPLCQVDMSRFDAPFVQGEESRIRIAHEFNDWLGDLVLDHVHTAGIGLIGKV
ncbi:hypothetical protein HFN89_06815 [Rhizobium laguerreae]|nr:hypothetical protein [Rhizobium laguerreae]